MAYYTNEWGGRFDTYEEAREATLENMEFEDLSEELAYSVSYPKLLEWAMKQPGFYEHFEDQINDAENEFCNEYITEWEDDEE